MPAERIIAVDFGTSTSVVRVKRYLDGRPIGDRLETKPVTFNMGSTMVPTLVQKKQDTGESVYFGHDAETSHKKTETFRNFKVDIENPDSDIRTQARELTAEFFGYLAKTYRSQSDGGHLGESDDKERTIISYPVKWSEETKAFMIKTAQDAGFPNVEGLDEAQAAIQAVTAQNADHLQRKGYFKPGIHANILLIDMGAGTTDLVLCRYTPGDRPKNDILATWPKKDGSLFGGQEMDDLLKELICSAVPEESVDIVRKKMGPDKFKAWKEAIVSPALARGESVDYFSALDDLLTLLEIDADYLIDRNTLENFTADYLRQLPELINGCLGEAGLAGDRVDLVILTGGHSQWYFVREILNGRLSQLGDVGLDNIQDDPDRIISISLPQETVALGLAYQGLELMPPPEPLTFIERVEPTCWSQGHIAHWRRDSDGLCFADEAGTQPLTVWERSIQPLEHDFRWEIRGQERVEFCTRCGEIGRREQIAAPKLYATLGTQRPAPAPEPTVTPESEFELSSIGNCYGIKKYNGNRAHVVIPEEIRGLKVIAIDYMAFSMKGGNKALQSIVIPPSVKTIGPSAFIGCVNLKTVIAHGNIETIGKWAFLGCKSLQKIDFGMGDCPPGVVKFPTSLKSIGEQAFNFGDGLLGLTVKCALKEVWLSKKTKLKGFGQDKAFTEKKCAIFYYDKK